MVSYTGVTSRKSPFPDAKDTNPLCNPCMSLNYNFIWLLCYLLVLVGLAGYGFHRLSIVYLYWKNRNNKPQPKARFQELPVVTVQLPMFNEKFVVDRLLESVAALDYPQDKLEIQILDDSTDDTTEQCYRKVEELKSRGFDAVCIHRTDRTGFKAGALEAATKVAKGEFLLILDADFVPEPDLLQKPSISSRMKTWASFKPAGATSTVNTISSPASRGCTWTAILLWNRRLATVPAASSLSTALPAYGASA